MTHLLLAGIVLAAIGGTLALTLALANQMFYVFEDPRVDEVEGMLPGVDCGACGCPTCRAFAESTVEGKTSPAKCTVCSPDGIAAVAAHLGVDPGKEEKRVARLACAGGSHVAWMRARYEGMKTCRASALVAGGAKGCAWGCLGLGDCACVCEFGAITMDEYGLPVVDESKCTACGDCVEICPKGLFSIHPASHRLWVACKSLQEGEAAEAECEVACNACGRCAADAPGVVSIVDNLAVVDFTKNHAAARDAIQRCPTGAIVWIDEKAGPVKGAEAKHITRKSSLPVKPRAIAMG